MNIEEIKEWRKTIKRYVEQPEIDVIDALLAYVTELEQQLSRYHNLLAVAHRDGGQYLARHGEEKAGEDAITAILAAYHNNDRYQGGIEVEGYVCTTGLHSKHDYDTGCKLAPFFGQRVRVHAMEVE